MNILLMILGLAMFLGLVVVHEFGHFIMARRNGVDIEEFGIFFPPRLYKHKTKRGWLFTINLLPLGGFVKLKGEHDIDTEKGSMGAASVWAKAKIMAAGVTMNLIAAFVLFVILALIGMPQVVDNQFNVPSDATYLQRAKEYVAADTVEAGSPASKAGIKSGDTIEALGKPGHLTKLEHVDTLPKLTQKFAGQTVEVEYQNDASKTVERLVTLRSLATVSAAQKAGKQMGYMGVSVYQAQDGLSIVRSTWSAPIVAAGTIKQFTVLTFEGLGKALAGVGGIVAGAITGNTPARQAAQTEASSQVAGPVGIFFIFKYGSVLGFKFILLVVALLSLTLAIMNILPIPALDGGRLWLMLFTRAIRRPLSPSREEAINAGGFAFLMGLVILITVVDVRRFF